MLVLIWSQVLLLYQCNYPEGLFFSSGLAVEAGLRVSSYLSCGLRLRNYRAVDRGIINSAHVVFGFCVLYRRSRRLLQLGLSAYPYQERPFRTAHRINLFACYWRELETICSVLHIWSWWGEIFSHDYLYFPINSGGMISLHQSWSFTPLLPARHLESRGNSRMGRSGVLVGKFELNS